MRAFLFTIPILAACVSYEKAPVHLPDVARSIDARSVGPLDFAGAVAYANEHNPDLKRLAAEARAAGLDIPETGIRGAWNEEREDASVLLDPLALARVYQRGSSAKSAQARQVVALARLREHEREIAARIARVFLVERVLRDLENRVPEIAFDPARFQRAGLASKADSERAEFARIAERAERETLAAERRANNADLRRLLALPPHAEITLNVPAGKFPVVHDPVRARLLQRPDLAVAVARYYAVDAEFREAVLAQYPSFQLGAQWDIGSGGVGGLVALRLPVGASARAEAAGARRDAAREAVLAELLRAQEEAESRHAHLLSTQARADAFAARARAAATSFDAALQRLRNETDAFGHAATMASLAARTAMQARQTALVAARARVAYAEAYGWPRPEEVQ